MIEIRHLTKKYGDTPIFEDVSFSFPNTGLVCVLGPSGCGKSTLLNLLAGFDTDYAGSILVHGRDLKELDSGALCIYRRDNLGFVFQNYHLLKGYTALENITLAGDARGEDSEDRAREWLKKLGLEEKADQKTENLSGGQKQRIAIARALVNDPAIVLADEPTGALDRKNASEIMALLKELGRTRLVIVITHDGKCAEAADYLVTLRDGQLCCDRPMEAAGEPKLVREKEKKLSLGRRVLKNFRVHLPRYLAVAGAISLGVVCFALSLSTGNVMDRSIRDFEEKNAALHSGYVKGADRALLEELAQDPRLENVYAQYKLGQFTLTVGDSTAELPEKYPMSRATEQMSYGSMPRRGAGEIALTPSLAAKFSRDIQNLPGKTLLLTWEGGSRELTVSGIYNAGYDDFFVSSDLEQEMYEGMTGEFYSLSYDAKAFADIVTVARELTARGIPVRSAEKEASAFLETFQNLNRLFRTVSALAFSVGLFISAVLLAKQQNTRFREVGLLAALGYPAWAIRRILLGESLLLSCLAAAFTGLLSLAAALAAGAAGFPLVLTMPQAAASLGGTAVIILAVCSLVNLRLTRAEPAKALRG